MGETTRTAAHHSKDLAKFMRGLAPGDQHSDKQIWFDARRSRLRRFDWCKRLAEGPLWDDHETVARRLVTMRLKGDPGPWFENSAVRTVGEQLCAEGGRWLMILVAHRAQYIADPMSQAEDRLTAFREGHTVTGAIVTEGLLVRELEYGWAGICGWQH